MRLPEIALLSLLTLATSAVTHADAVDLKPFKASYLAEWKGMTAGASILELRKAGGDTFTYTSVNNARGMFRLAFPDALTQTSTFRLQEGAVQPLSFKGADDKQRPIDLVFDWAALRVTGVAKEHNVDLALPAGAQDPMSLQIATLRSLAANQVNPSVWMIDGDKLKEYELRQEGTARVETALGALDTIIYTSKRANSDRVTRTWVAPALGYLPVKAERVRGKKVEFVLKIESLDR
jgi:Protein of unknown function (DUF3108)